MHESTDLLAKCISNKFKRDVYQEIINCNAFKRLRDIRFLGAIDYFVRSNSNQYHTRYHHSLGVALLGLLYAKMLNLNEIDEKQLVIAALLHDIGHAPLSHSLEPVFKEKFDINHYNAGEKIIRGDAPIGKEIYPILKKHNIDLENVISLIKGQLDTHYVVIFNNPINIDTIEAILRAQTYLSAGIINLKPIEVLNSLIEVSIDNIKTLDRFWQLKNTVYKYLINSAVGILADYIAKQYLIEHIKDISIGHYFLSESEFRKIYPQLFDNLKKPELVNENLPELEEFKVNYIERKFIINKHVKISGISDLDFRYRQIRCPRLTLLCKFPGASLSEVASI